MKNKSLENGGFWYFALHDFSDRLMISFGLMLIMLIVATVVSIFVPHAALLYIAIVFGPALALVSFGGILPRRHWTYNLTTNQRLAIERYRAADEETKKLFPADFEQTVRNAKSGSTLQDNDQYQLARAAEKLLAAAHKRARSLNLRDDDVEVALTLMQQGVESLEVDTKVNKEIYG